MLWSASPVAWTFFMDVVFNINFFSCTLFFPFFFYLNPRSGTALTLNAGTGFGFALKPIKIRNTGSSSV